MSHTKNVGETDVKVTLGHEMKRFQFTIPNDGRKQKLCRITRKCSQFIQLWRLTEPNNHVSHTPSYALTLVESTVTRRRNRQIPPALL